METEPSVLTPKRTSFGKQVRKEYDSGTLKLSRHDMTSLEQRTDGISNTLTSVQKDNLLLMPQAKVISPSRDDKGRVTGYHERDTAGTLCVANHSRTGTTAQYVSLKGCRIRKFTPRECFRLMGVAEADIDKIQAAGISDTQQYRMAGNSIVVDVLFHVFRKLFVDKENEVAQQTLF